MKIQYVGISDTLAKIENRIIIILIMFDKEFKKALELLSGKEKDKLILRLLKKDLKLARRLYFELVDTDSVADKRQEIATEVAKRAKFSSQHFYSPGYLLMDAREISGIINDHVSQTKDKQGEISLNCLMIRHLLEGSNEQVASASARKSHTFCIYVVARMFKIMMLIKKQHEDLHIEFSDDVEAIGELIGQNHAIMKTAIHNGLDVNWLIHFNIPDDIVKIHKELRQNGYLR